MKKSELAEKIQNYLADKGVPVSRKAAGELGDFFFDILRYDLVEYNETVLEGIGRLKVVERAPRDARNPRTGEIVKIPLTRAVKFTIAKGLKEQLNNEPA